MAIYILLVANTAMFGKHNCLCYNLPFRKQKALERKIKLDLITILSYPLYVWKLQRKKEYLSIWSWAFYSIKPNLTSYIFKSQITSSIKRLLLNIKSGKGKTRCKIWHYPYQTMAGQVHIIKIVKHQVFVSLKSSIDRI